MTECITTEVEVRLQENAGTREETNPTVGEFWEMVANGQTPRKASSDSGFITLNKNPVAACDLGRALEIEGEVRRLGHVIDQMQGKRKPLSWRIMLDDKYPLSVEIMGIMIPRDFRFSNLKYSGKSDLLVHIRGTSSGLVP